MDMNNKLPQPIQWSEGMLLSPQHFQQNDLYWQQQLSHQAARSQPYFDGVLDLDLDESALQEGTILLKSLTCIMPDGLLVQYPEPGNVTPLRLELAKTLKDSSGPLKVSLVVPVRSEGSASQSSMIQRYKSVSGKVEVDENTGEGRVPVARLRTNLALMAGDDIPAKYEVLPLLTMQLESGGTYGLTTYHPPMLRMGASGFLQKHSLLHRLQILARDIREKARALAGRSDQDAADNMATAVSPRNRTVIYHLTCELPALETLVRDGKNHPHELYLCLCRLAGQVAAISADPIPPLPPVYDHYRLQETFHNLIVYLARNVEAVRVNYDALAFNHREERLFERPLRGKDPVERLLIEVRGRPGQSPTALAHWLKQARIGTKEIMPELRRRRLTGARIRPLKPDELRGMNLQGGGTLFEISNEQLSVNDKQIPVIHPGKMLQIEGPDAGNVPSAVVMYLEKTDASAEQRGADLE